MLCAAGAALSARTVVTADTLGITQASSASIAELVRGAVAGVIVTPSANPISPSEIIVRGSSSVHTDNAPLWIVDGVIMESASSTNRNAFPLYGEVGRSEAVDNLFHISPYDIESIEILSDASATALYGSRGAAGVIIVKTKINGNENRSIDVRANVGAYDGADAPSHNYYIGIGGGAGTSAYNVSLSYRHNAATSVKNTDAVTFKVAYKSNESRFFSLGFNVAGGIGSGVNGDEYVSDYDDNFKRYGVTASAFLNFNFNKFLSWTVRAGADLRSVNRSQWYGPDTEIGAQYSGLAGMTQNMAFAYNAVSTLKFERYFAADHKVNAMIGVTVEGERNDYTTLCGSDFFAYDLHAKGVRYANSVQSPYVYNEGFKRLSPMATLGYSYKNIAGVSGSFRADRTFDIYDGRYNMYPAGSAFFDIRNLAFAGSKAVSAFRIEGGYGWTGAEKQHIYPFFSNLIDNSVYEDSVESAEANYLNARNFRLAKEWNVGVKLAFLEDRICLEAKYFDRNVEDTFDIFTRGALVDGEWTTVERSLYDTRTSAFTLRGYEASVKFVPVRTKDWTWTVSGNGSYAKSQLTKVDPKDTEAEYTANILGESPASLIGYTIDENGYYIDRNGDGAITKADCTVLGNTTPTIAGSFGTTLRYKFLTLDVRADYAAGFNVADLRTMISENRYNLTSRYVSRGDYLRLGRVALACDVPLKNRSVVKGLNLALSACDIATFSRYAGPNPDVTLDLNGYALRPSAILSVAVKF